MKRSEYVVLNRKRSCARQRALARLALAHPAEFKHLLNTEYLRAQIIDEQKRESA